MELNEIEKKMQSLTTGKVKESKVCGQCKNAETRQLTGKTKYYCQIKKTALKPSTIACANFKNL